MDSPSQVSVPRRASALLTASLLAALVVSAASPVQADADPSRERTSVAAHYAGLLEQRPEGAAVVVDDTVLGDYDRAELERSLHESFDRLDVDYYVVARADVGGVMSDRNLLPAIQDRMGEPGLYVLLQPGESRVHALGRGVDLPLREADQVIVIEHLMDYYTPLDTKADVFVEALTAPDLAERTVLPWYTGLPTARRVEGYLQKLALDTVDGPDTLGEATAAVVGATATLWLLVTVLRRRRRGRAAQAGCARRPPGDRALTVVLFLTPVTGALAVTGAMVHLHTATLPQEEAQVGPPPPATAPYVASTDRLERVAEELAEEPLYVDPLAAQDAGDLSGIAERLAVSELPVHTAVVAMADSDESGGDPEIFAHALHHVMDEDGVFVVVDGSGVSSPEVEAALFGFAFDEEAGWNPLSDVTGPRFDATVEGALEELLDVVDQASAAPGEEPPVPHEVEYRAEPGTERSRLSMFFAGDTGMSLLVLGPLAALALMGAVWSALAAPARMNTVPGGFLHPRADRAVRRAARAVKAARTDQAGLDRSLREADTALAVLGGEPDELDLVGVVVLADRAVRRLHPDPGTAAGADVPVCMVNPLHGPAAVHGAGRREPLCASCAALPARARERRTLRVASPSGGRRPHLDLDRLWVRTGYGAQGPLDTEDLMGESRVR